MPLLYALSFIFIYLATLAHSHASTSVEVFYRLTDTHRKAGLQAFKNFETKYLKGFDPQYQKVVELKVIDINTILAKYEHLKQGMNLALLHFDNAIIYPMIIDKNHQEASIFLATEIKTDSAWTHNFADSVKGIQFSSNKIFAISEKSDSPKLLALSYASSLNSIEIVDAEAYHRQFQIDPKQSQLEGRIVYLTRCQFCHGLGGLGAKFAPDFLNGLADRYESSRLYHLVHPKGRLAEQTKMMPHQKGFTREEARQLWNWLWKAKNQKKWNSYQPFYARPENSTQVKPTQN